MPTPAAPARPRRRASVPDGVITAIVGVTGARDQVEDVIVPGAFARTLKIRRPKVVFHHDWLRFLGRTLSVVELMPGDSRLPKKTKEGKPWPSEAGALVAVMQFNLATEAGRDGYEWARFYTESDECEWSIGYKVVPGRTSKGRDGVRYISDLDVFEFSLVLFGAASLSMTLDIKAANAFDGETKNVTVPAVLEQDVADRMLTDALESKAAEKMAGNGVMIALYPPADVADALAVPDGSPAEDLHVTLAFLGDAADLPGTADELADVVRNGLAGLDAVGPLSGTVGGLGQFPDSGDGAPTYVPVDVPDLTRLRETIADAVDASPFSPALARNHGFTPHLTLGYALDGVQPVEPTDVTFDTVYVVVGPDRIPVPLDGQAPVEGKSAAEAVLEAKQLPVTYGYSAFDAVREAKNLPGTERIALNRTLGGRKFGQPARPQARPTARKPAVRAPADTSSGGSGTWDESKHPRGAAGTSSGGKFVSKGSGYSSTGRADEAPTVVKAQEALIGAGLLGKTDGKDGNGADGLFGAKTEAATKRWQQQHGYTPDGKLSADQLKVLTGGKSTTAGRTAGTAGGRRKAPQKPDQYGRVGAPQVDKYGRPKTIANPSYNQPTGVATVHGPRNHPVPPDPKPPVPNPAGVPAKVGKRDGKPYLEEDQLPKQGLLGGKLTGYKNGHAVYSDGSSVSAAGWDRVSRAKKTTQEEARRNKAKAGRGRVQHKSAWDTVMEAKTLQSGLEGKYDTSSLATAPGSDDNWIEAVGGELPPFVRAVAHALVRDRGKTKSEAIAIAIGRIKTWASGGGNVTEKTRAKAVQTVAAWEALKAKAKGSPMEGKSMHQEMPGSFESVRDQLNQALRELLTEKPKATMTPDGMVAGPHDWVCVEATFPTYVIVSHERDGKTETYQVDYAVGPDGTVKLGKPEEITLRVVAEPANEGDEPDGDIDDDTANVVRYSSPAAGMLDEATAMVMLGGAEGKSADVLRPALMRLLDALAVKGMPDVLDDPLDEEGDEEEPTDSTEDGPADDDPESLSEQLVDEPAEDELEEGLEEKADVVTLDVDEVARQLESLRV